MTPSIPELSIREQLVQALATFDEAHRAAEDAAAHYVDVKRQVGTNEAERKALKASTPPNLYEIMVSLLPDAEAKHKAAAAHLERVEKNLNVLRELYQGEIMEGYRAISAERAMTATIEDTTAQRYVMAQQSRTVDTPKPYSVNGRASRTSPTLDESDLPF